MNYQTITLSLDSGIARLTLNRPEKLNSFNEVMHAELRSAIDLVHLNDATRVLVVTGAGRGFCAGQDLSDPALLPVDGKFPDLGLTVERNYQPLILQLQNLRVPTIAAVNGIAAGAGAALALACDLVIASKSASFVQAFSKIGLIPDTGSTWVLPKRVGMARAMGLALLAEKLSSERAADWGLIWECVDDAAFSGRVNAIAKQLADGPTKAYLRTRQAMFASSTHTLEQQLMMEAGFMRELGWSNDYAEGVVAFSEKRPPKFEGN